MEYTERIRAEKIARKLARGLHGQRKRWRSLENATAALQELVALGWDIKNHGEIFDCGECWRQARQFLKGKALQVLNQYEPEPYRQEIDEINCRPPPPSP